MLGRSFSRRKIAAVACLFSASLTGSRCLCDARKPPGGDKDASDFLSDFAKKGKAAMDGSGFQTLLQEGMLKDFSKKTHEVLQNGVPGQIGYGFLMGYSSGFCLKKVSKILAFTVGGFFIVIQTLSFNGYMQVNYDKVEKAANKVLDVNHDGKVDAKDAEVAYAKMQEVLSYNMPTGGGFATGLVMGLRS